MNAILKAQNAYGHQAQPIRSARETEYNAFARITYALKSAETRGQAGFRDLVQAVHDNRRLWTILASEAADRQNPLPRELRARILYLAEFSHLYSRQILQERAPAAPLVEINSAIMAGLRAPGATG